MTAPSSGTRAAPPCADAPRYTMLGGVLASALPFPGVAAPADGAATDWTLGVAPWPPAPLPESPLGRETLDVGSVRLARTPAGFRLAYEDTGCFDVSGDGRRITWYEPPRVDHELARIDVTGRVLAVALHAAGILALHGSAVALGDGAVAFVAPKGHGKSSLAAALLRAGARLLTDDTLPVVPGEPCLARPGLHHLRLLHDSAAALLDAAARPRTVRGGKLVADALDAARLAHAPTPLAAVYELAPARALPGGDAAAREAIAPLAGMLALVRHARIGALLGAGEAPALLRQAAGVAGVVPVYRLHVAAGLEQLDAVAARLLAWHGGAGDAPGERA